jgi:DNA-binding beta-propeller fold protein YncE
MTPLLLSVALPIVAAGQGIPNHPTGTHGLIMVDKVGERVLFFDPSELRQLSEFQPSPEEGMRPHEVAISPDRQFAYVSVYGSGVFGNNPRPGHTIAVFDLKAHRQLPDIDVAPYRAPHGLQVDARGNLYVACDLDGKVLVIDAVTRRIRSAIDVQEAAHWIALSSSTNKLYTSAHGTMPFIGVIDTSSGRMLKRIPIANGTNGIAVSPNGTTLLAADAREPVLHIISTRDDREVDQVRIQDYSQGLYKVFYSPNGRYVLTCLPNGQINIFDAKNLRAPQRVLQSPGSALMGLAFSADDKLALVGNHGEGTVSQIDLISATITRTFAAGKGVETLAYY